MAQSVEEHRGERIAKLLARAGVASRREIERMIAGGRIARDGVAIDTPATVLPSLDGVTVDGNPVAAAEPARLFLYHKPPGLLVTERDPRGRPTIYDRLPKDLPRLVPVGRLDLATEGLLLLTTDGGLKRQLELPATGVERTYRARVYGPVSQPLLETLIEGIEIDGFRYGPIDANLERRTGANSWIELTLAEGKNREVRRVLEHLGLEVSRLIRTRYGPFVLGDLPPGAVGEVRQGDLVGFRQTLGSRKKWPERIAVAVPLGTTPQRSRPTRARPLAGEAPRAPAKPQPHAGGGRSPVSTGAAGGPKRFSGKPLARAADQTRPPVATGKPFMWRGDAPTVAARPDAGQRRRDGIARPSAGALPRATTASAPTRAPSATARTLTPDSATLRPAKPQRKAGWAKPKPKSGPPRRPTKPRA